MVNKCAVVYCKTGYADGPKKSVFHFPNDPDLRDRWTYFTNRKNWTPTAYSVICIDHFDPKYIKHGKKCKLLWNLSPVPTIHTDMTTPSSVFRKPLIPRHVPTPRYFGKEQLAEFEISDKIICLDSLTEEHCPKGFSITKYNNKVVYYNLCFDDTTSIPSVHESIIIDESLHVSLAYKAYHVTLPVWFRSVVDIIVS